jgi:hypothetical protein
MRIFSKPTAKFSTTQSRSALSYFMSNMSRTHFFVYLALVYLLYLRIKEITQISDPVLSIAKAKTNREAVGAPSSHPTFNPTMRPTSPSAETKKSDSADHESNKTDGVTTQKKKNNLVLHVGPQKTGSTTLQWAWREGVLKQSLKKDNYVYSDMYSSTHGMMFDCELVGGKLDNCKPSQRLKELIQTAKNDGQNLLLSSENLDYRYPEIIRSAIDDNDWEVTIIVVYRRIYEWLVSFYNQANKNTDKDAKGNLLLNKKGVPTRKLHTLWPDEGGVHIPSFSSWYKTFTQNWESITELVNNHQSIKYIRFYNEHFENVVVHNMHRDGDLMTNIMCDTVPDANYSCDQLKSKTEESGGDKNKNLSKNLNHDIIAVTAREHGLINEGLSRQAVVEEVRKHIENTSITLPENCDSGMIDQISTWLVESEKVVYPDAAWTPDEVNALENEYRNYATNGKMCDIDREAILRDPAWIEFFSSLGT